MIDIRYSRYKEKQTVEIRNIFCGEMTFALRYVGILYEKFVENFLQKALQIIHLCPHALVKMFPKCVL